MKYQRLIWSGCQLSRLHGHHIQASVVQLRNFVAFEYKPDCSAPSSQYMWLPTKNVLST
jgi:hypothetical protein